MAKRTNRSQQPRRPNYFETSSPFETHDGAGNAPQTFRGYTDTSVDPSRNMRDFISGSSVVSAEQAEQYDNPRGYPGLALVTTGSEKSKLPFGRHQHSIAHHMEGEAKLTRTGK